MAVIALGPLLVGPVLATAGWPLRRPGAIGGPAVSGVGGAPRRAAAISVVALEVALVFGALVRVACLGGPAERRLATDAPTDLRAMAESKGFGPDLVRRVAASPTLTHVITCPPPRTSPPPPPPAPWGTGGRAVRSRRGRPRSLARGEGRRHLHPARTRTGRRSAIATGLTAIERTREFGLYGVLGGVLGLALGVPYALLLVRVVVTGAPLLLPAPMSPAGALC